MSLIEDVRTWTYQELLEAREILGRQLQSEDYQPRQINLAGMMGKGATSNPMGLLAKMAYERRNKAACPGCAKGDHDEDCTNPDRVQPLSLEKAVGAKQPCAACASCEDPGCDACVNCRYITQHGFRVEEKAAHLAKAVGAETECLGCANCPDPNCKDCEKCRSWRRKAVFRVQE